MQRSIPEMVSGAASGLLSVAAVSAVAIASAAADPRIATPDAAERDGPRVLSVGQLDRVTAGLPGEAITFEDRLAGAFADLLNGRARDRFGELTLRGRQDSRSLIFFSRPAGTNPLFDIGSAFGVGGIGIGSN